MLINRQLRILQYLLDRDYSGSELATLLKTSRRTIIRDIAVIDSWLTTNDYGQINNLQHYSLVVVNRTALQNELQQLQFQKYRILYHLLTHQSLTLDELAETFFISKKEIDTIIRTLNQEYQHLLLINKKAGKGVAIGLSDYERINLVASLLFSYADLLSEQPTQLTETVQLYVQKNSNTSEITTILLFETKQQLTLQRVAFLICHQQDLLQVNFDDYLQQKLVKIDKIQKFNLAKVLLKMNYNNQLALETTTCATMITQHLQRTISFPSYFGGNVDEQFKTLKIEYPFIFDFAISITEELQDFLDVLYIDNQYIALYMINAQRPKRSLVNIVMYEERHSISNINQKLLMAQIQNIDLQVSHSIDELTNLVNSEEASVLIVDRYQITKTIAFKIDYLFDGLINNDDLDRIQDIVSTKLIRNELLSHFKTQHFLSVNARSEFTTTLRTGLHQLINQGELTGQQVDAILEREAAGNQLLVGHLSIPHIRADIDTPFKLYYLKLETAVKLQSNEIEAMLVVVVNPAATEYSQLFSYLYAQLKDVDLQMIKNKDDLLNIFTP